jgi:hypothetical protein
MVNNDAHVPPCGTVRVNCVLDPNNELCFMYSVGHAAAQGSEILVLNVSTADHYNPHPDGQSTIEVLCSMLTTLREDALGGHAVLPAQVCACTAYEHMPMMMLVAPRAAEAARFFDKCVTEHLGGPLLVLLPLTLVPAVVAAGGKAAIHDFFRDVVLPDYAASLPGEDGQHGRAGSVEMSAAFTFSRGA